MRLPSIPMPGRLSRPALGALALLVMLSACGLDEVSNQPLVGPAEQALSIQLQAIPNILNADGVSTSTITITLRNQNGDTVAGQQILVWISTPTDGDITVANVTVGYLQSMAISLGTSNNGQATVVYRAGTNTTTVFINVQAYSYDAQGGGQPVHYVAIDQQ